MLRHDHQLRSFKLYNSSQMFLLSVSTSIFTFCPEQFVPPAVQKVAML